MTHAQKLNCWRAFSSLGEGWEGAGGVGVSKRLRSRVDGDWAAEELAEALAEAPVRLRSMRFSAVPPFFCNPACACSVREFVGSLGFPRRGLIRC